MHGEPRAENARAMCLIEHAVSLYIDAPVPVR